LPSVFSLFTFSVFWVTCAVAAIAKQPIATIIKHFFINWF
jgi:hypothetical protein